jgi:tRNA uridine 5-carbamoylmethylation protein Kti12
MTQPRASMLYFSYLPSSYLLYSLENLLVRFEEPSSMVRWDAPLFTIMWNDEEIPGIQIWEVVTQGSLKPPNSGTLAVSFQVCEVSMLLKMA